MEITLICFGVFFLLIKLFDNSYKISRLNNSISMMDKKIDGLIILSRAKENMNSIHLNLMKMNEHLERGGGAPRPPEPPKPPTTDD